MSDNPRLIELGTNMHVLTFSLQLRHSQLAADHHREALELGQMQERSMRETAQMLGISVAAAKARLFHARAALKRSHQLKSMRKKWFPGRTGRFDAMGKMGRPIPAN